jgi:hypothetical protein
MKSPQQPKLGTASEVGRTPQIMPFSNAAPNWLMPDHEFFFMMLTADLNSEAAPTQPSLVPLMD